jgi:hypothetical protein
MAEAILEVGGTAIFTAAIWAGWFWLWNYAAKKVNK